MIRLWIFTPYCFFQFAKHLSSLNMQLISRTLQITLKWLAYKKDYLLGYYKLRKLNQVGRGKFENYPYFS